jgi:hypothetical protein
MPEIMWKMKEKESKWNQQGIVTISPPEPHLQSISLRLTADVCLPIPPNKLVALGSQ